MDNLVLAEAAARKGKSKKYGVRVFDKHRDERLAELQKQLLDGTFKTSEYKTAIIFEPKERKIYKLPYYPDRIVHHAIMNVLEPIWVPSFTADTYSNIKGRGLHQCANRLRHALYIDKKGTRYCLKTDIRKYYPNINHEILKREVRTKIKDKRMLALLDGIIDSEQGLPIGNYLSQYFANVMLSRFDHRLKEKHGVRYYFRYVDDMVFLSDNKEELRRILGILRDELAGLGLELKPNWQIFPVDDRGIDFLGYVFYHGYTLLRKTMKQKVFKRVGQYNRGEMSAEDFGKKMASYNGWLEWCDSFRLRNKINNTIKKQAS